MKSRVLKNIIAFAAFIVFALFLVQKYIDRYENSIMLQKLLPLKSSEDVDVAESIESNTETYIETEDNDDTNIVDYYDRLDPYYTRDNINYERIANAKDTIYKEKLIELLNRFAVSDLKEIAGQERLNYIKLYDGMKIVGDSNVRHFDYYQVLEKEYYYPFAGKSLEYQTQHAKEYVDKDTKKIIFWNGYNIARYSDSKEYIDTYQALVDKVKEINPDVDVYVCSLMPATDEAIKNDLKGDIVHNVYRGREYDNALKEHFGDKYIDIKFIGKEKYYGNDGIHFMPQFYYMLVPYIAYYLNLEFS